MNRELNGFRQARERMVEKDLRPRGITDLRLLHAFQAVPRHLFVDSIFRFRAYDDNPLPIGNGQTISQPYVVAAIVQSLKLGPESRVLDIGTGCGYQAAILSLVCKYVYSVEVIPALVRRAKQVISQLNYHNVSIMLGDGRLGWKEFAPYDAIAIAAWGPEPPYHLFDQLKVGGRLVMPVRSGSQQELTVFLKESGDKVSRRKLGKCAFVPLVQAT